MDFFNSIGKFFGGLFGGGNDDEERRRQQASQQRQAPQQQRTTQMPTPQWQQPQQQQEQEKRATVQPRKSIFGDLIDPINKPQQPKVAPKPAPQKKATAPTIQQRSIAQAQKSIQSGGAGAPFKPEIVDQARKRIANPRMSFMDSFNDTNLANPIKNARLSMPNKPKTAEEAKEGLPMQLASGFQQMLGRAGDAAIQGGSMIGQSANLVNPFINEDQRMKLINRNQRNTELLRGGINSIQDVIGNNIVGNRDVDEAAGRIAAGQGSAQDITALAGRGLDIAGTVTMGLNPARILSGTALRAPGTGFIQGARELAPFVAKEAGLFGALEGTTASLEDYGANGNIMSALSQFAPNFLLGAGAQVGLEGAAYTGGRALSGTAGNVARLGGQAGQAIQRFAKNDWNKFTDGYRMSPERARELGWREDMVALLEQERAARDARRSPNAPQPESRDPSSPITNSPATNKTPAITSPNPGFVPASAVEPPVAPQLPPEVPQAPRPFPEQPQPPLAEMETPPVQLAGELEDLFPTQAEIEMQRARQAINEAAVQPPEPAPVIEAPVEAPSVTQSRRIAEEAAPINTQAVEAQAAQRAAAEAPTEAIAQEMPQYTKPVKTGGAGIPGKPKTHYNTGDGNLDGIVNDSIIAAKGTAQTAGTRGEALEGAGITPAMQKRIRDVAVKNVDKNTGRISLEAQQKIRDIVAGTDTPAPRATVAQPKRYTAQESIDSLFTPGGTKTNPPREAASAKAAPETPLETPKTTPKSNADPRIRESDARAERMIQDATEDGVDYGKLAVKLRRRSDGTNSDSLTDAERKVQRRIKPELDKIAEKLNRMGLTDDDVRRIGEYLPTTNADELSMINSADDVAARTFGFDRSRAKAEKGGLSDEQIEDGAADALKNYLRVGALVDDLSPGQIKTVKQERLMKEFTESFEKDGKGGSLDLKLSDKEIARSRKQTDELIDLEQERSALNKKISDGKGSEQDVQNLERVEVEAADTSIQKKVDDYLLLEKKTNEKIKAIKADSSLSTQTVKQRTRQLEAHLNQVRNDTGYIQSTVRTNLLFGVGRIADQVNKAAVAVSDKITAGARVAGQRSFKGSAGRDMFADKRTSDAVYRQLESDPRLNTFKQNAKVAAKVVQGQDAGKNMVMKGFGKWRVAGTKLTEAGSRYKIANKDTVSYFTSKAQSEGITDVSKIAEYVSQSIGTKEWNRVQQSMFDSRNLFTGMPTAGNISNPNAKFSPRNMIYDTLGENTPLSRTMRENIADGITIPLIGFPKLLFRLGARGVDSTSLGSISFLKAMKTKPVNEAEALKRALLIQQGFRSAQSTAQLGALGMMAGVSGAVTGAYPERSDGSGKARAKSDQFQPFSLKVGDTYVELGRYLGPLAAPFMAGALVGSGDFTPENAAKMTSQLTQQVMSQFGADSVGDVMQDVGALLSGEKNIVDIADRYGAGIISSFAPGSSLLNTTGKAEGMIRGTASPDGSGGFVDALMARFPGTRNLVPGKEDSLGNPISQGTPANLLPGVTGGQSRIRSENPDTYVENVRSEIDRLAGAGFETMPGKKVKNMESQRDADVFMATKTYGDASDERKAEMLKKVLTGNETKDIHKSITGDERSALIEHKLMKESSREKWRENNDNAANYYTAKYNNLKANDDLSSADDNLQEKGGAKYKMVRAQVNKAFGADVALQHLYENTTQSEWRAMTNPESDDYDLETAEKLFAYDAARTSKGVSGKSSDSSKHKYTEKKQGGGSGRGSAASRRFGFAQLPTSLIGVGGASGGSGGKYAANAPTFKPIADLQAPKVAAIPKGRTISIKKGINV